MIPATTARVETETLLDKDRSPTDSLARCRGRSYALGKTPFCEKELIRSGMTSFLRSIRRMLLHLQQHQSNVKIDISFLSEKQVEPLEDKSPWAQLDR